MYITRSLFWELDNIKSIITSSLNSKAGYRVELQTGGEDPGSSSAPASAATRPLNHPEPQSPNL